MQFFGHILRGKKYHNTRRTSYLPNLREWFQMQPLGIFNTTKNKDSFKT